MKEIFKSSKRNMAVVASCVGLGALTGCAPTTHTSTQKGEFQDNSFYYPDEKDSSRIEMACRGTTLVVKNVRNTRNDRSEVFLVNKACENDKLTSSDDLVPLATYMLEKN